MCGINGLLADPHRPAPPEAALREQVQAMNAAVAHRGPDDEGVWTGPGVALGFRRLAIVDLSPAGQQPMTNEDGTLWGVFNGEIYNHVALRDELTRRGHVFRSRCDAEVVLHAWECWGEDALPRLNGMFAFALWCTRTRTLVAVRDRLGVKPLMLHRQGGELAFSSEVAGLRAVRALHRADAAKLHDYLAYGYRTNDGRTLFHGVEELPPGHLLTWQDGRVNIRRWWTLPPPPAPLALPPEADHPTMLRSLLADAVRLRLQADVPVALLQSGGLDSSAVCALVDDAVQAGEVPAGQVSAFTVVHPGEPEDESDAVRQLMARCPGIQWVPLTPPVDRLADELPRFVQTLQEPTGSATVWAHQALMREVRSRGVKVMLNGQGADEALAGYGRYVVGHHLLDLAVRQPGQVVPEMAAVSARTGQTVPAQLAQVAKALLGRRAAARWRGWVTEGGLRALSPAFRGAHANAWVPYDPGSSADRLDATLREQLLHYGLNQILQYEDLSSMAQGIEMRSPFLDFRVVQFAFTLPHALRFSEGRTKRVLRDAFEDRLPSSIVHQGRKIGFATPFDRWARTPAFRSLLGDLTASTAFRQRGLWQADRLADWMTGRRPAPPGFPLWRFVCAELWLQGFGLDVA